MKQLYALPLFLLIALPIAAQKAKPVDRPPVVAAEPRAVSRDVEYRGSDIVAVRAFRNYVTALLLPETEEISEVTLGDREYWVSDVTKNIVHVKPAKEGAQTNMNVVTTNGNIYTFLLTEGTRGERVVDLRVKLDLKDTAMRVKAGLDHPAEDIRRQKEAKVIAEQIAASKAEVEAAKATAEEMRKRLAEYPQRLVFDYEFKQLKAPFYIAAIFHDDQFTYVVARPAYPIAVYETIDGTPSLVQTDVRNGTYIIRKVLNSGYLKAGKATSDFSRLTGER